MKTVTANIGEKIEVKSTDGEIMGYFYFNPADPEIFERCNSVQEKLREITKTISDNASIEEVQKLNKEIRKQMEYLLGESASNTFFRYNSPLSITSNGSIYAIYIFDIIYDFISKEIAQRSKKVNAAMDKYTEKYKK